MQEYNFQVILIKFQALKALKVVVIVINTEVYRDRKKILLSKRTIENERSVSNNRRLKLIGAGNNPSKNAVSILRAISLIREQSVLLLHY